MLRAQLAAVIQKEVRQTVRDRRVMALLIVAPLLQLVLFGFAVNLDVDRVPTTVVDLDDTPTSRAHIRRLLADGTLEQVSVRASGEDAGRELVRGASAVAVVVPPGYERTIERGVEAAELGVMIDGSNPNRSGVAAGAVGGFGRAVSAEIVAERLARRGTSAPPMPRLPVTRPRVLYNPRLETAIYMVPGIASMLLLVVTTIVMSMGLARERESGTLEQVLVTPVRPWVLLVGKMLPFAVIGLVDFLLALVVGSFVFDMPIVGSVPLLFFATFLYLVATLAMGLLVSTVSSTQQQAFLGGFLVMLPAALLSGIMTPIHAMPEWLQPLTLVNPLRHYADALRAVLLRGATLPDIAPELGALVAIGAALAMLAVSRFRKTLA